MVLDDAVHKELKVLAAQNASIAGDLQVARAEMAHLRAENAALRDDKVALEAARAKLNMMNVDLSSQMNGRRFEISDISQQLRMLHHAKLQESGERGPAGGERAGGGPSSQTRDYPASLFATPRGCAPSLGPKVGSPPAAGGPGSALARQLARAAPSPRSAALACPDEKLGARLADLKAKMAAAEVQGASLRAATQKVQEEYQRVVDSADAGLRPDVANGPVVSC